MSQLTHEDELGGRLASQMSSQTGCLGGEGEGFPTFPDPCHRFKPQKCRIGNGYGRAAHNWQFLMGGCNFLYHAAWLHALLTSPGMSSMVLLFPIWANPERQAVWSSAVGRANSEGDPRKAQLGSPNDWLVSSSPGFQQGILPAVDALEANNAPHMEVRHFLMCISKNFNAFQDCAPVICASCSSKRPFLQPNALITDVKDVNTLSKTKRLEARGFVPASLPLEA